MMDLLIIFEAGHAQRRLHDSSAPTCTSGEYQSPDFVSLGIMCTQASNVSDQIGVTQVPDRDWHLVGLNHNRT